MGYNTLANPRTFGTRKFDNLNKAKRALKARAV